MGLTPGARTHGQPRTCTHYVRASHTTPALADNSASQGSTVILMIVLHVIFHSCVQVEAKKAEPRPELRRGGVGGSERRSHSPSGGAGNGGNAKRWGGGYDSGSTYQSARHPSPYGEALDSRDTFAPPISAGGWAAPVESAPAYKADTRPAPQQQPLAAAADPYSSLTCSYASQPGTSASFTTGMQSLPQTATRRVAHTFA